MLFLVLILHHYMGLTVLKGSDGHFVLSFHHFDKFACQNGGAGAMKTPLKCLIFPHSGGDAPPVGLFFLRSGVVGPLPL